MAALRSPRGRDVGRRFMMPSSAWRRPDGSGGRCLPGLRGVAKNVTRSELLAAFGDDTTAVLVYDTATIPVSSAPGADLAGLGGRISPMRIIFDRTPFEVARQRSARAMAADAQ